MFPSGSNPRIRLGRVRAGRWRRRRHRGAGPPCAKRSRRHVRLLSEPIRSTRRESEEVGSAPRSYTRRERLRPPVPPTRKRVPLIAAWQPPHPTAILRDGSRAVNDALARPGVSDVSPQRQWPWDSLPVVARQRDPGPGLDRLCSLVRLAGMAIDKKLRDRWATPEGEALADEVFARLRRVVRSTVWVWTSARVGSTCGAVPAPVTDAAGSLRVRGLVRVGARWAAVVPGPDADDSICGARCWSLLRIWYCRFVDCRFDEATVVVGLGKSVGIDVRGSVVQEGRSVKRRSGEVHASAKAAATRSRPSTSPARTCARSSVRLRRSSTVTSSRSW